LVTNIALQGVGAKNLIFLMADLFLRQCVSINLHYFLRWKGKNDPESFCLHLTTQKVIQSFKPKSFWDLKRLEETSSILVNGGKKLKVQTKAKWKRELFRWLASLFIAQIDSSFNTKNNRLLSTQKCILGLFHCSECKNVSVINRLQLRSECSFCIIKIEIELSLIYGSCR